ncbi:MAG: tRNA (guanosine(37)-N1)-methyltransferase TrmD [Clostridiales Family XIII bacterium]|jgi:tRNA (guanine37-N1)-methyltransferase|nr:tRNA (guanosine(37)-N1)-methyltransferase TrmD [Clostridiales Family XIII bacterium]
MNIDILTLFPGMFDETLNTSILRRARERGTLNVSVRDIRAYSADKHRRTDDCPFGGGAGMVMTPQPVFDAMRDIGGGRRLIYMSPRGRLLDGSLAQELGREENLLILCGHYEGMDQRVLDHFAFEEISIGDYILTGGELPAMVLIDAVVRLLPGVLGNESAHAEESIYSGLLEYPQYTRPATFEFDAAGAHGSSPADASGQGRIVLPVPEVLLSGNHREIRLWNFRRSLELTADLRPDLFRRFADAQFREDAETDAGPSKTQLTKEEKRILEDVMRRYAGAQPANP